MEIGERIRDLRKLRGFTQADLAERMGISVAQLSRIEGGKTTTLRSDMLILLSKELNVTSDYLLGLSPMMQTYDCSQLGLSEKAVQTLLRDTKHKEVLNFFIEDPRFPKWVSLIHQQVHHSSALDQVIIDEQLELLYQKCAEMDRAKKDPDSLVEMENDIFMVKQNLESKKAVIRNRIIQMFSSMLDDAQSRCSQGLKPGEQAFADFYRKMTKDVIEHRNRYKNPLRIFQTLFHYVGSTLALDRHTGPKFLKTIYLIAVNKIRQLSGKPPVSELPEEMIPDELPKEITDALGKPLPPEEVSSLFSEPSDSQSGK